MGQRVVTEKELRMLDRWEKFVEAQGGVYPSTLAALKLRMTTAGVYQAGERGWLAFFQIGRDRWYGRRDVCRYNDHRAGRVNRMHQRHDEAKNCTDDDDGGKWRTWTADH